MKTLIEIHALQNFAPSNLNRDDTGAPKDTFFGGTRRARVSSQCLKRSVREYFRIKSEEMEIPHENLGNRSKRLLDEVVKLLVGTCQHGQTSPIPRLFLIPTFLDQ